MVDPRLTPANCDPQLPMINADVPEHHCFGCGDANPASLLLRFRPFVDGSGVWCDLETTRVHEGYVGLLHGGILSTMADEGMSWAITNAGFWGMTARMSMRFHAPAPVGATFRVGAWVIRQRSRLFETAAQVVDIDGRTLYAEAEGSFIRVRPEQAEAWQREYGVVPGSEP